MLRALSGDWRKGFCAYSLFGGKLSDNLWLLNGYVTNLRSRSFFLDALQTRPACDRDAEPSCPQVQMKSALRHLARAAGLTPLLDVAGFAKDVASFGFTVLGIVLESTRKAILRDTDQARQLRELAQLPPAEKTRFCYEELSAERRRSQSLARLYARAQKEIQRLERGNLALQASPLVLPASLSCTFLVTRTVHWAATSSIAHML